MANLNPFAGLGSGLVNPFDGLLNKPQAPIQTSYGTIPKGFPNSDDLFASLLEFQWRGIGFPVADFDTELAQRHTVHDFADRDGAHVEPQGRRPLRIMARVPLLNYITRGKRESWVERQLYPAVWRKLFAACADRTSGTLQHPELAPLTCKCENMKTRWEASVRGGVWVTLQWIQSDDNTADLANALSTPSPAASVFANAAALDAALKTVSPLVIPQPYVPPISFSDLANAVRGVVDQVTLLQKSFAGRIANIIYECNALESSLTMAENALNWPLYQMAEELKASCIELSQSLLNGGGAGGGGGSSGARVIKFYTTTKDATLAQVAASVGSPVADIMQLNSAFVSIGIVPSQTQIRYYAAAA